MRPFIVDLGRNYRVGQHQAFLLFIPVYEMARLTWRLGAWIRHSRWYPDFQRTVYR